MKRNKVKQLVEKMVSYYESTRRTDGLEPTWILSPFDLAYERKYDDLAELELPHDLCDDEVIRPFQDPVFGLRVLQGGYKIGTASWVFLGRRDSRVIRGGRWLATARNVPDSVRNRIPPAEFWTLCSTDDPGVIYDRNAGLLSDI